MIFAPIRVRRANDGMLLVGDAGDFALSERSMVERLCADALTDDDRDALSREGLLIGEDDPLGRVAHAYGVAERIGYAGALDYLILVPTLRCNLSCSYCQVSRVAERSTGFDWNEATLAGKRPVSDALCLPVSLAREGR